MISLIITAAAALIAGCGNYEYRAPERPESVPGSAVWHGGPDGGHWVDCNQQGDEIACSEYWQNGRPRMTQRLALCFSSNPSDWVAFGSNTGDRDNPVGRGLVWTPVAPAVFYDEDGAARTDINEKYAASFEAAAAERCSIQ